MQNRGLILTLTVITILFNATGLSLAAQAPLSLDEVLAAALKTNPAITEAQKRWEEKQNRVPLARALPNPKLGIMKDDIPTNSFNPLDGMMTEYTLSQEFMNPGKLDAMGKMAESDAAMSAAEYEAKKLDISTQVKQAYYDYLYNSQAVQIMQENQQLMKQLVDLAQINYSTGMVALQDTLKAQTEVSKMDAEIASMGAMASAASGKVNTLMGRPANAPLSVKEVFRTTAPTQTFDTLSKQSLSGPAVRGMEQQVEMAKNGVDLAKRLSNPDFELSLGRKSYKSMTTAGPADPSMGGMPGPDVTTRQPSTWSIGVMAMIPLWGDKNQAEVKSANSNLEASQAALQNMKNMQAMDIQMALSDAQAYWRQIELYQKVVIPQSEATYQAAIVGYGSGKVDMMDMLEGVNTLRNAKLALYKAKVEYEKAMANLEKAVGKTPEAPKLEMANKE
ncbi:MAG: czcC [Anaerosporomusa subterranea]|jgi:outer membrane protein TolC|nr:czcC [Anaerosporomusa subterranea]